MTTDLAKNTYRQIETDSASQLQLVVMLYDGAIRFLGDAAASIQKGDLAGKAIATGRALDIIGNLQSTLKMEEGGEIAHSLDRLYTYMTERVLEGSAQLKAEPMHETIRLLRILNSAWTEIAKADPAKSAAELPAPAKARAAGANGGLEIFG